MFELIPLVAFFYPSSKASVEIFHCEAQLSNYKILYLSILNNKIINLCQFVWSKY